MVVFFMTRQSGVSVERGASVTFTGVSFSQNVGQVSESTCKTSCVHERGVVEAKVDKPSANVLAEARLFATQ
jgi:hypothetical protein